MAVLPFRRHGRSRVEAIHARLKSSVQMWLYGWAVGEVQCHVRDARGALPEQGTWLRVPDGAVTACLPALGLARLGSVLAATPMGEGHALADAIGRRALKELLAAWLDKPGIELVDADRVETQTLDVRHGVLSLCLTLDALAIELHLSPAACDVLAEPMRAPGAPLCNRREALRGSVLKLNATLDLGSAGLDAAATLRPGEIIKATAIQDARVNVHAGDGTVLFSGALDSIDGHKALRCTSVQKL